MDHRVSPDSASTSLNARDSGQSRRFSRNRPSFLPNSPPSPPSLIPLTSERPVSLQARRLQLRNAGFRGVNISARKISDQISSWRSPSGHSELGIDKENQLSSPRDGNEPRDTGSVRKKVNVLQEIHNSSHRSRQSRRPSVTALFPTLSYDEIEDHHLSCLPSRNSRSTLLSSPDDLDRGRSYPPPYSVQASIFSSPIDASDDSDAVSVIRISAREGSLSPKLGTRKRDTYTRTPSYGTTRYIEHLETQLAAAQRQLSPMQSPSVRPQVSKLRALTAEIKVLKQEIAEWQCKFEARVKEEIDARTEIESKLRSRIRFLEGQIELNSHRIKELECEKDIQAQKLRNAESLRSTNRGLERRVDVLTELLAQSPTRTEPPRSSMRGSDVVSPSRSPGPRLSRPVSMLPCIPLDRREDLFQPLIISDRDAIRGLDPLQETADEVDSSKVGGSLPNSLQNHSVLELDPNDSILDESSQSSTSASKSQRSSTVSQVSSMSSWSSPFHFSPDGHGRTPGRPRSMRRFPSGTCTLKPLILPTTNVPPPNYPPQQSVSSDLEPPTASFDPTTEFLEDEMREIAEGMVSDYGHFAGQGNALAALEGRTSHYITFDEAIFERGENLPDSLASELSRSNATPYSSLGRSSNSIIHDDRSSLTYFSPAEGMEGSLPSPRIEPTQKQYCSSLINLPGNPRTPMRIERTTTRNPKLRDDRTPKAYEQDTVPQVHESWGRTLTSRVTDQSSDNLLDHIGPFKEFKGCFTTLARKYIASVWSRSLRRFGKLSWWVLGLLLGSQNRDLWFKTTPSILGAETQDRQGYSLGPQQDSHSDTLDGPRLVSHGSLGSSKIGLPPMRRRKRSESPGARLHPHGIGQSLFLWAKFSVALVVAVGLALRHGPESLLEENTRVVTGQDRSLDMASVPAESPRRRAPSSQPDGHERCSDDDASRTGSRAAPNNAKPTELVWTRTLTVEDFFIG